MTEEPLPAALSDEINHVLDEAGCPRTVAW